MILIIFPDSSLPVAIGSLDSFVIFVVIVLFVWERILLYSLSCPGTNYVGQANFRFPVPSKWWHWNYVALCIDPCISPFVGCFKYWELSICNMKASASTLLLFLFSSMSIARKHNQTISLFNKWCWKQCNGNTTLHHAQKKKTTKRN